MPSFVRSGGRSGIAVDGAGTVRSSKLCASLLLLSLLCLGTLTRVAVGAFIFSDYDDKSADEAAAALDENVAEEMEKIPASGRQILVFGGNGFLGSSTVERLVRQGDAVSIVNRGNWYWDSKRRIAPRVTAISCDRQNGVASCSELVALIAGVEKFDAVVDFSAYGPKETRESTALLRGKAALYIHISTDSIYDVCDNGAVTRSGSTREEEAVRPSDPYLREMLSSHHDYGNRKMQAEEELVSQRVNASEDGSTGIPYVILRLPDVLGPRDTTYRFWIYQLWIKLAPVLPDRPVSIPQFLTDYNNSFVYVDDVARVIADVIVSSANSSSADEGAQKSEESTPTTFVDQAFNLAWRENVTLERLLRDIESALGGKSELVFQTDGTHDHLYLYPTVRRGPIDVTKATKAFNWTTTPWTQAINDTVAFYETAMKDSKWKIQRDEIIQVQISQLYSESRDKFLEAVEKIYAVDLSHFKPRKEEL